MIVNGVEMNDTTVQVTEQDIIMDLDDVTISIKCSSQPNYDSSGIINYFILSSWLANSSFYTDDRFIEQVKQRNSKDHGR